MNLHYTSVLLCVGICPLLHAQTLDNGNTSPVPGDNFTVNTAAYMNPGAGGSGQTWNFATIGSTGTMPQNHVTPASTGYGGSYPGATVALNAGGGNYAFYQGSAAGFDILGFYSAAAGSAIVYQNSERIISYPCSYNTSWTDPFSSNFTSGGFPVTRSGSITGLADGFGTLVMPYGTVTNVLRVRTIEDYSDVITGFGTIDYLLTNHYFYKPGTHLALLAIYDQEIDQGGGPTTTQSSAWLAGGPVGMDEALRNAIGIDLFPNPATSEVAVVFGSAGGAVTLEVMDATGRIVRTEGVNAGGPGIARHDLSVGDLPAGLYTVRITSANGEQGLTRLVIR